MNKQILKKRVMMMVTLVLLMCCIVLPSNIVKAESVDDISKAIENITEDSGLLEDLHNLIENGELDSLFEGIDLEKYKVNIDDDGDLIDIDKYLEKMPESIETSKIEEYLALIPENMESLFENPIIIEYIDILTADLEKVLELPEVMQFVEDLGNLLEMPEISEIIDDIFKAIDEEMDEEELDNYIEGILEKITNTLEKPEISAYLDKMIENIEKLLETPEMTKFIEDIMEFIDKILEIPEVSEYIDGIMEDIVDVLGEPEVSGYLEEISNEFDNIEDIENRPELKKYLDDMKEGIEELQEKAEYLENFMKDIEEKSSEWAFEGLKQAGKNSLVPKDMLQDNLKQNITRKEFVNIAVTLYEVMTGEELSLPDVNPFIDTNDTQVLKAYKLGIIAGMSENTFSPDSTITREQMATIMTNLLAKAGIDVSVDYEEVNKFADDAEINEWAKSSVYFMANNGIIKGVSSTENIFDSKSNATKEQAILISNLISERFNF